PEKAATVEKEIAVEQDWLNAWRNVSRRADDVETLLQLADEEDDADLASEIESEAGELEAALESLELRGMLRGADDPRNAIVTIHPGGGGTESQDWVEMLLRMYTRSAERNGYKQNMLEFQPGDVAGIKSASLRIERLYAYGYLRSESGVHRLV